MEHILELAQKKAQKAEIFRITKNAAPACFYAGKLAALEGEQSESIGLRVIVDGKLGFSSTTHPNDVEGLVQRAVESAAFGPTVHLDFPHDIAHFGQGACYDARVEKLSLSELVNMGEEMVGIVRSEFPEVNLEVEISREILKTSIMNTNGGSASYEKTIHQAFLNVLLMLPSDRAELEDTSTSTHLSEAPLEMARRAVWRFKHCLKVAPMETKRMTVMFTSLAFRGLFVPLFYGLNGELVHRKLSLLTGRVGETILDPRVTLLDDPTMAGMPGSCPVDDEGVPTFRKHLFDKGVLSGFVYDLETAGKAGVASSGNGFKKSSLYTGFSVDAQPNPTPSNFVIEPGDVSRDDLIRSIKDGIIVDDTMGAGQGNNLNGEFSFSVALGYRVIDGEIVGRIKDVMVAGNVFEIFKHNLRAMTKETWPEDTLFGRYCVPWIAFDDMPVAAT